MRIVARSTLRAYWEIHGKRDSETPLKAWFDIVAAARWRSHDDVKASFGASVDLAYGRYAFNIGGNKHRLICRVDFVRHGVLILWIGPHADYDDLCANGGRKLQQL